MERRSRALGVTVLSWSSGLKSRVLQSSTEGNKNLQTTFCTDEHRVYKGRVGVPPVAMYQSAEVCDFFGMPPPSAPPSYEETVGEYSPSSRLHGPPPIPPRAAELAKMTTTDLNDNCNPILNRPALVRIPTITVTSAPSTPEVLDNEDHVINMDDHVTQTNQANDNANNINNIDRGLDYSDLDPVSDVREPGDGEDGDLRETVGSDTNNKVQLDPSVIASLEKRVSWSGEYIEGRERVRSSHQTQNQVGSVLGRSPRHSHRHHRRKLSTAYAKASMGHSLTFPPAYEEFAQYASYQNGVLFNPADLRDEGDEFFNDKKSGKSHQQQQNRGYVAPSTLDPYYYSLSHRKEEAVPRVQVSLQRLPQPGQIQIAASQPKEIAQYQRKDWTEDEFILETPVCGIISIISHVGALVWFAILIWQLRMRDIFEAQKWETIGNGWYTRRVDFTGEFDKTMLIIAGVFLGLSYATILFESMASYAETYLSNFMSFQEAMDHVRHVRRIPSKITWRLECYIQDELNPMPSYTKLEDGQAVTRARKKTHHTRHWVTYELPVTRCVDASGEIKGFRPGVVSRVEFSKTFGFIDEKAAMQYEILKREFLSRHPNRVPEAKVEETLEIEGFKDRITVFFQSDGRPPCMRRRYFWFCTLLLLGWPYRWWFRNNTEKCRFTYIKLVELGEFVDR